MHRTQLLPLCILLSASSGFDLQGVISPDSSNFFQKYAMLKLYESCLGLETIHKVT